MSVIHTVSFARIKPHPEPGRSLARTRAASYPEITSLAKKTLKKNSLDDSSGPDTKSKKTAPPSFSASTNVICRPPTRRLWQAPRTDRNLSAIGITISSLPQQKH